MMCAPEVSVVMSVYNGAAFVGRAVESILSQEGVELEFVIVNDGSTDASGEILHAYARRDPRIRLIEQRNIGLTRALGRGCAEARGSLIARQDADDVSLPGRMRAQMDVLRRHEDVVLAFPWIRSIAPGGEVIGEYTTTAEIDETTRVLRERMIGVPAHGSVMFRRDAYERAGGYREEFYYAQDLDLWLRLAWEGRVAPVPAFLYELQHAPGSISSDRREVQRQFAELALSCYRARRGTGRDDEVLERVARLREAARRRAGEPATRLHAATTYLLIGASLESRGSPDAISYYAKALAAWPLSVRVWRATLLHLLRRWGRGRSAAAGEAR